MKPEKEAFMIHLLSRGAEWLLVAGALCLALWSGRALADLVPTQEAAAATQAEAARERVMAFAQRPGVASELQAYGLAPDEARSRVDAMSDAEVIALAGRLDALPAAGALSNEQLLIVVLLIILIAVLL